METLDNGKPYMNSFGEMMFSANMIKYYAGSSDKVGGKTIPVGKLAVFHLSDVRRG